MLMIVNFVAHLSHLFSCQQMLVLSLIFVFGFTLMMVVTSKAQMMLLMF